jgi:5-methylcytosine-specific restriction endonuclease McrBC regulatory subunit McrC
MEVQQIVSQQMNLFDFLVYLIKSNIQAFRLRGPRKSYLWKRISELHKLMVDIQTTQAKLGSQDGNSREH